MNTYAIEQDIKNVMYDYVKSLIVEGKEVVLSEENKLLISTFSGLLINYLKNKMDDPYISVGVAGSLTDNDILRVCVIVSDNSNQITINMSFAREDFYPNLYFNAGQYFKEAKNEEK